jgi:4-amino-4-deoxy-L-arabinose transferase-like glycosyltransferase
VSSLLDRHANWLLAGVLLLAVSLRAWGIGFGLPHLYHPDEPRYVRIAQTMFTTGDLNPGFFNFPSLFLYINALAYPPYHFWGEITGRFAGPRQVAAPEMVAMAVGRTDQPAAILLGRSLTVAFGSASVILVYLIGRQLTGGPAAGPLAALMVAVSPTNVTHSRFITPDTFQVTFVLAAFLGSLLIYRSGKTWHYVLAGVSGGLAASTKYTGALILATTVAAHFLRTGWRGIRDRNLYLALGSSALAFVLGTPYALIDLQQFLKDMRYEARHYSEGHAGMEGHSLTWYLAYLWRFEGPVAVLALLGIVRGLARRSRRTALLAVFPLLYFAFIARFVVRNDRTVLPITPFLCLLAAWWLLDPPTGKGNQRVTRWQIAVLALLIATSLAFPFLLAVRTDFIFTYPDSAIRSERSWLPLTLFLLFLTAAMATDLSARVRRRPGSHRARALLCTALVAVSLALPTVQTLRARAWWTAVTSRETARIWIDRNLPRGSRIAIESYAPYVDPAHFDVQGFGRLIQHRPEWYVEQDVEYLVFGQGMFERYYRDPDRYGKQIAQYEDLFRSFELVRTFTDGGYEVLIYQVTDP